MLLAETNAPYPDRIQLLCGSYTGAFLQSGPLGAFNPVRDLEVYVDGTLIPVRSFSFDADNNRYLLYLEQRFNLQGVIQIIHHMPSPPFQDRSTTPNTIPGFAILASYSEQGDSTLPPSVSLANKVIGTSVYLIWETVNVATIHLTANNGVDAAYDSGSITTVGSGLLVLTGRFTVNTQVTLTGYNSSGAVVATTTSTVTIT